MGVMGETGMQELTAEWSVPAGNCAVQFQGMCMGQDGIRGAPCSWEPILLSEVRRRDPAAESHLQLQCLQMGRCEEHITAS